MKGKASCPMCRGSMCFKGFTRMRRHWYQDKREQVYLDLIEELFEQYNEEYKDVVMTFFNVIQNRYEYIKLNYPNVACEVLEPLLRVTWIDVDYLMNNSNEIFYEPFTFEKYLMISKYENKIIKYNKMFLVILILLLLSVTIGVGGYISVKMKGGESEGDTCTGDDLNAKYTLNENLECRFVGCYPGFEINENGTCAFIAKEDKKNAVQEVAAEDKKNAVQEVAAEALEAVPESINCERSWGPWIGCNVKCNEYEGDGGTMYRIFDIQGNDGTCEARDVIKETGVCRASRGEYKDIGTCSKPCGGGVQRQEFTIDYIGHDRGASCPTDAKFVPCNTHPCPVDCIGHWTCISDRRWKFHETQKARYGGRKCEYWDGYIYHGGHTCN
jgi:hypothetical protein